MTLHDEHMDLLPDDFRRSLLASEVVRVQAQEHENIQAALLDIADQFFVQTATWGLQYWEAQLGVPVSPAGVTDAQRRAIVLARLQGRRVGPRKSYADAILAVAPASRIQHDYLNSQMLVRLGNFDPQLEGAVEALMAKITPAHLNWNAQYGSFVPSVSKAGDTV